MAIAQRMGLLFAPLSLFALDTPVGVLNHHFELFHYTINALEDTTQNDSYATALGGFVAYRSKPLWGWGMAYKHYFSHLILDAKNPCKTALCDEAGNDINPLAQLYLYYQNASFEIRLGKQQLDTPLLNNDTTRLIPYSYEGLSAIVNLNPQTKLSIGHIDRFRTNISQDYTRNSASGYAREGVSYVGVEGVWDSANFQGYYYHAHGLYDALYTQLSAKTPYNSRLDWLYGVESISTFGGGENIDNRNNGGDDVRVISTKIGLGNERFSWIAAFSFNESSRQITHQKPFLWGMLKIFRA